ncbi:hypothetical protein ACFQZO_31770 [Bradyrhizobium sp. GCM10027634]|uniref:hypothetical protein n=1 Tax=unclassified Bradyrhizobium TaxID=2631580 RepID=UPI00188C248C|nr:MULTISPECIES: hypothetical protein [unclassified Bradyrhizobium]MDN5005439.1 hypothetical protein [Bradyrhizobium sp. WYCCWR 12677]
MSKFKGVSIDAVFELMERQVDREGSVTAAAAYWIARPVHAIAHKAADDSEGL